MTHERITEILESLDDLEYPNRIGPAEEAVNLADRLGDQELAWKARFELLTATVFGGEPEKALVAFAWLESKSTQEPERFPASRAVKGRYLTETDLLWGYKWIGLNLPDFVEISRRDIEAVNHRMRDQFEENHVSLRPYWTVKACTYQSLGDDRVKIQEAVNNFEASPRDIYADCFACEWNFRIEMALLQGDLERAFSLGEKLIEGNYGCASVPHITFTSLMIPAWRAGLKDKARVFHQRGYDLCKNNRDLLISVCEHIDFRLLEGDWPGAYAMLQRHVPWAHSTRSSMRRLRFLRTALAVAALAPAGGDFGLPTDLIADAADPRGATEWKHRLNAEVILLAERFDERNGNTTISEVVRKFRRGFSVEF